MTKTGRLPKAQRVGVGPTLAHVRRVQAALRLARQVVDEGGAVAHGQLLADRWRQLDADDCDGRACIMAALELDSELNASFVARLKVEL